MLHSMINSLSKPLCLNFISQCGGVALCLVVLLSACTRQPITPVSENIQNREPTTVIAHATGAQTAGTLPSTMPLTKRAPERIGMLLPLSGRYQTVGSALQLGALTAHFSHLQANQRHILHTLRFYDVGPGPDAAANAYQQATQDGMTIIVGPVNKDAIDAVLSKNTLSTPLLILNQIEYADKYPRLYQFGLAPEDEARQIAEKAYEDGYRNAGLLIPDSGWGKRLADGFRQRFEQLGGRVIQIQTYAHANENLDIPTHLLASLPTHSSELLKPPIDMIFLDAAAEQGRLLVGELRNLAKSLPAIYSTSHLYSGRPSPDKDRVFDGIVFPDMPWVLNPGNFPSAHSARPYSTAKNGEEARLFAFGYDAYSLASLLNGDQRLALNGASGHLQINNNQSISRTLIWARFNQGYPQQ
jgi:outer membrane PBP1 activator LpoA protein